MSSSEANLPSMGDLDALATGLNNVRCFALGTDLATAHMLNWPVAGWGQRKTRRCPVCETRIDLGMHPLSTVAMVSSD